MSTMHSKINRTPKARQTQESGVEEQMKLIKGRASKLEKSNKKGNNDTTELENT